MEEKMNPDHELCSENEISQVFYTNLKIERNDDVIQNEAGNEEEEEEEEEEFSFMCGGENGSPIAAEDIFIDGQIKPVFPLFNGQDYSVYSGEHLHENLPTRPPVNRVFVETVEDKKIPVTSSSPENDDISGPYCDLSTRKVVEASPEVCKKSNSTGFSKIWRLRDLVGRSNSDGRDAFVYLNSGPAPPSTAAKGQEKKEATAAAAKKSGNKGKTASLSAHEVYLRSKAKEEERPRRSTYLPYRPELMGFFTNVNGGLTKNVHPY